MSAVTSKYESFSIAIKINAKIDCDWKPYGWSTAREQFECRPCVFSIYLFFFSLDSAVFERRGRNAFSLLLNDSQDCTWTGGRKLRYDLFPSNVASETTANAWSIARCVSACTHMRASETYAVQFLTRLIRSRYRLSNIFFERVENRAFSLDGRNKTARVESRRECRNKGIQIAGSQNGWERARKHARAHSCDIGPGLLGHRDKNRRNSKNWGTR